MTSSETNEPSFSPETGPPLEPSWKPLIWLVVLSTALIALGELFFDLLLEGLEALYLVLFEVPEEFLEDKLEDWLKVHYPHDADRYSEITTAIGLTPVKILLGLLLLRWLWRHGRGKLLPRFGAFCKRQYGAVRLAWQALQWFYKILIGAAVLAGLMLVI